MRKDQRKKIEAARSTVNKLIDSFANGGNIAAGMASEGYNGGYRDALDDVLLLLDGNTTPSRHNFWQP